MNYIINLLREGEIFMSQPTDNKQAEVRSISRDPVKHYVRVNGWVLFASSRLEQILTEGSEREYGLRYFTLCGEDGLDIYLFQREGLLIDDDRGFPSAFYCEKYRKNFIKIRTLLGRTPGKMKRFQEIINLGSFQMRIRETPFDVVNLDFSGVCFPISDPPFSITLQSIRTLIELQSGHGFDLYITFRAFRTDDNEEAIDGLIRNMDLNFVKNPKIREEYVNIYGDDDVEGLSNCHYGKFLLTTIPKIILRFGYEYGFVIKCQRKYIYERKKPKHPKLDYHIVKYIFTLEPEHDFDPLVFPSPINETIEEAYYISIIEDLKNSSLDVDEILEGDPDLIETLRLDNEKLLNDRIAFGNSRA